jgi:cyclopropane fatty-acyl-phospholipid synthase-like methyltransferase
MTAGPARESTDNASAVRAYYESNTRLFLSLGIGGRTLAIRRAVWGDGVQTLQQAVDYVNGLIAAEARLSGAAMSAPTGEKLRILDIGCGVGGSLLFLADSLDALLHGVGVTISPRQAEIARRKARARGHSAGCSFLDADFTRLSGLPLFHLTFAIESFVHFTTPLEFFSAAARSLAPGGRLILIDDFLAEKRRSHRDRWLIKAFRQGWILPSLCPVSRAEQAAVDCGMRLVEDRNLSASLHQTRLSIPLGLWAVRIMRAIPVPWSYWRSSAGSLALTICQRERLVEYHYLVFEKQQA